MLIMNPGTHANPSATLTNAEVVSKDIMDALKLEAPTRLPEADCDGWFRFLFKHGEKTCEVDIPGDDPEIVMEGMPFKSRRIYVDGSSWYYGIGLGIIEAHLEMEDVA